MKHNMDEYPEFEDTGPDEFMICDHAACGEEARKVCRSHEKALYLCERDAALHESVLQHKTAPI